MSTAAVSRDAESEGHGPSSADRRRSRPAATAVRRSRLRRWLSPWRVGLALAVLGLAGWLGARHLRGTAVAVHVVDRAPLSERVVATGRVMSPAEVQLGSVLLGTVAAVHAEQGERVEKGAVLVELDDTEARAAVAQAKAAVGRQAAGLRQVGTVGSRVAAERRKRAAAELQLAERRYQQQQRLYADGAVPKSELDDAERALAVARSEYQAATAEAESASPGGSDYRVSQAALAEAKAGVALAEARLTQTRIVAPASGVILRRDVEPGDVVRPGEPLLVLARDGATRLEVFVDEKNLGRVRAGLRGKASSDAFPDQRFDVEVAHIAPAVDAARGTIEVRLDVLDPPPYLRPDMTVSVDIEVGRKEDVVVLPLAAVRDAATDPYVLVAEGGRAVRRPLELGARDTAVVEIEGGLEPGEQVVLPSDEQVEAGDRIRVESVERGGAASGA